MLVLLTHVRTFFEAQKKERPGYNQTDLGEAIGMTQQNAGNLLRKDDVGLSYPNATRIAQVSGFDGVDEMFRAHAVFDTTVSPEESPAETRDPWPNRAGGKRIAKQMGATETAIRRVTERCADAFYRDRKQRWWVDEFLRETDAEKEGQALIRERGTSDAPAAKPARASRRKAS